MYNRVLLIIFIFSPQFVIGQFTLQIPSSGTTQASAIDDEGNAYVSAVFESNVPFDFDPSAREMTLGPGNVPYVASYDQLGNLRYAFILENLSPTPLGSFNNFTQQTLLVDNKGNIFLIGVMSGWVDFNPGGNINDLQTDDFGEEHGFIVSYNSNGEFRFLHDLGRTDNIKIYADISPTGDLAITYSLIGEAIVDNTLLGDNSKISYYILKLNSAGKLNWAYAFYSEQIFNTNTAARLKVDDLGNIYLMNVLFKGIDLDPDSDIINLGVDTLNDASYYISSYSPEGKFRYAHKLSENFQVGLFHTYNFEVDQNENIYVYGPFIGTVNFEAQGNFPLTSAVSADMFLVSYNNNGKVRYGHSLGFLGSTTYDGSEARPLFSDILPDGRLLLSGWFKGDKDFDPSINQLKIERNGDFRHTFINIYDVNGEIDQALGFLTKGNSGTLPWGINSNKEGKILVNGFFSGIVDFDPFAGESVLEAQGGSNYLTLMNLNSNLTTVTNSQTKNQKESISLSPNPSNGLFTLQLKNGQILNDYKINVYQTNGMLLSSIKSSILGVNKINMNLSHLNDGLYFVVLETVQGVFVHQLVIQK